MTSGNALKNCCRARQAIPAVRPRTIGVSSRPFFGSCVPVARGAIYPPNSGIGIEHSYASPVGARKAFGRVWPRPCGAMRTWSACSLTPRSYVPTSIRQAPKKAGFQEIDRSRGGLTTKLHVAVDALGNPLRVILSAGQITDIEQAEALIKDQPAEFIVADKGYDSDAFVQTITAQGSQAVIPPRSNRLNQRLFDRHIYKGRNLIERFFSRIKQFRRIATRYDKLAQSFLSFVHLACTFVWLA